MAHQATNLHLPSDLVAAAREYVQHRKRFRRGYSLSELVSALLADKLRKENRPLPAEYYQKES